MPIVSVYFTEKPVVHPMTPKFELWKNNDVKRKQRRPELRTALKDHL